MEKGKVFVIEGVDGSGKTTQYDKLCARLESENFQIAKQHFPTYNEKWSALVIMYLKEEFGKNADDIDYKIVSSFYAVDRLAAFLKKLGPLYNAGHILMLDRYTTANMVHQACKKTTQKERIEAIEWLANNEYNDLKLPRPDGVFYLEMPVEVSRMLRNKRDMNDVSAGVKNDIHEKDPAYMARARECGLLCVENQNWDLINCMDSHNNLRSPEDIHEQIHTLVKKKIYDN